jgi:sugar lactone lactonase YvrE
MQRVLLIVVILLVGIVTYLLVWPVSIEPVRFDPSENPGMTGPFVQNDALASVQHLSKDIGQGPEDITKGEDGFFYTGLQDGRIMRFQADGSDTETFVNTGGRPLGMQFDTGGNLIVADAFKGLLSVSPAGAIKVLTDIVNGKKLLFVDDLDIASDGTVWFSDASQRFDQHNWILDFWETRPTGRLLSYDPKTGVTEVRLDTLMFANGVALGPNDAYVLVNETIRARIVRLWLKGAKAGQTDIFLDGLPAYPDNLSYNDEAIFWVALPSPRLDDLERLWPSPFKRKVLMRLPESLRAAASPPLYGWVIGVDTTGTIVYNLQDPRGGYYSITSVNEFDNKLYLGSIVMSSVGQYALQFGHTIEDESAGKNNHDDPTYTYTDRKDTSSSNFLKNGKLSASTPSRRFPAMKIFRRQCCK